MSLYLEDRQIMILLKVRDRASVAEMAQVIQVKSYRTVQDVLGDLVEMGLVQKELTDTGHTKSHGYVLTTQGEKWLKDNGYRLN